MKIDAVKPPTYHRSYSNPDSQGTLIRQTAGWPGEKPKPRMMHYRMPYRYEDEEDYTESYYTEPATVPAGMNFGSSYVDRMRRWDSEKWSIAIKVMGGKRGHQMGLDQLIESSPDEKLIAMAKAYFGLDVQEVRWVYYYDLSTGYDCQRIDYIYKPHGGTDK